MIGKIYRKKPEDVYDAIIVGSGLSGLATAAFLAKANKKVLVLEGHYVAGGFTHTFSRKGYEWDVGLHYVGDVHKPTSLLRLVFDHITEGHLKWAKMSDTYDRMIIDDKVYDYVAGKKEFVENLSRQFPDEKEAIQKYVGLISECNRSAAGYYATKAMPAWMSGVAQPFLGKKFLGFSAQTTGQVLDGLTQNKTLKAVLSGQYGDYGLTPQQSSFAIQAMVAKHYLDGGNYPVGGSSSIARSILPVIEKTGGDVFVKAPVEKILVKKNKCYGVKLKNGDEILAPMVISSAGVINTFGKLLSDDTAEIKKLKGKLVEVRPSVSHVCLYIGIKDSDRNLGTRQSNLWIYPHDDHDKAVADYLKNPDEKFPVVYVSFPSSKDPSWESRHPGRSTMEVITLAPYDWFKKWEDKPWLKRGEDYDALKKKMTDRLLEVVYRHVPNVKNKIDYCELSTPLSTRHFCGYQHGEIYGIDHVPERFAASWLRPQTPIKNLYLTGQDITTDGIAGALMSGVLTSSVILKANLIKALVSKRT